MVWLSGTDDLWSSFLFVFSLHSPPSVSLSHTLPVCLSVCPVHVREFGYACSTAYMCSRVDKLRWQTCFLAWDRDSAAFLLNMPGYVTLEPAELLLSLPPLLAEQLWNYKCLLLQWALCGFGDLSLGSQVWMACILHTKPLPQSCLHPLLHQLINFYFYLASLEFITQNRRASNSEVCFPLPLQCF